MQQKNNMEKKKIKWALQSREHEVNIYNQLEYIFFKTIKTESKSFKYNTSGLHI